MLTNDNVSVKKRKRISQRQKRWLLLFFTSASMNATEAARGAGYAWPNHSGPENLKKLRAPINRGVEASMYIQDVPIVEAWVQTI
jgi:phage terminase small subunit